MDASAVITAVSGMAGATKSIFEAVGTFRQKAKGNPDAEKAASETLELVIALQARQIDFQAAILHLQAENAELREQIGAQEEWTAKRQEYELYSDGGATVYVRKGESGRSYCPVCIETKRHIIPLQASRQNQLKRLAGVAVCPSCQTEF